MTTQRGPSSTGATMNVGAGGSSEGERRVRYEVATSSPLRSERVGSTPTRQSPLSTEGASRPVFATLLWHMYADDSEALIVLTRMACPAPCVGYVNAEGWHLLCERKGRDALAVLRGEQRG